MGKKHHARAAKTSHKHDAATSNLTSKRGEHSTQIDNLLRLTTQPQQSNLKQELELVKKILEVLEKVKEIERDLDNKYMRKNGSRSDKSTLERFTTWLKSNGAMFEDATSIEEFPGYDLGIKANIDIAETSLIMAIPRNLMLTVASAQSSSLNSLIAADKILRSMPNITLAMFLLLEKFTEEDSFWQSYIDVLPLSYTTVLYFSIDELKVLEGSPTFKNALMLIRNIARQYAYFYNMINRTDTAASEILRKRFTYKEYRWAVSTVMTRQNTIPCEEGKNNINALIPLWDMCNHTNGSVSTDYNPELQRCECLAVKNFKAGEQLFIFYGPRPNADLFIHNGFVFEENEHDYYPLELGISQYDELREKRQQLLLKLNIDPTVAFRLRRSSPPIDGDLLAFLRIFKMNKEQLDHWFDSERSDDLTYSDCALETELETNVWKFLLQRMKLHLTGYKTIISENEKSDDKNLPTENSANKNLAIRMKLTEMRIIDSVVDYVEQCLKQLNAEF